MAGLRGLAVFFLLAATVFVAHGVPTGDDYDYRPNGRNNRGNEFLVGFMYNQLSPNVAPNVAILVTTLETDPVTVIVELEDSFPDPNNDFPMTKTVRYGESTRFDLPVPRLTPGGRVGNDIRVSSQTELNKGIRVYTTEADKLISVYGLNSEGVSTDAFVALPCQEYPTGFYNYFIFSATIAAGTTAGDSSSAFLIIPCQDNTGIRITPTGSVNVPIQLLNSGSVSPVNAGTRSSFTLGRLQTLLIEAENDLTGTNIRSDGPVAIFTGHQCARVPPDQTACDHIVEQIPPTITWGNIFFTVPLHQRQSGEVYRIGSATASNVVTITCRKRSDIGPATPQTPVTIGSYDFHEFTTATGTDPEYCCIETSAPAFVMQYSLGHSVDELNDRGDPFMQIVPPVQQYLNDYVVTPMTEVRSDLTVSINIAVAAQYFDNSPEDQAKITLNGSQVVPVNGESFVPIYCSSGEICGYGGRFSGQGGPLTIHHENPVAGLSVSVYGFARETSFGYPGGIEVEPIAFPHISVPDMIVSEDAGSVTITFTRTGNITTVRSRFSWFTRDIGVGADYATVTSDYTPQAIVQIFLDRSIASTTVTIPIVNDNVAERAERFEVVIVEDSNIYAVDPVGVITIIDDDAGAEIGFDPTSYSVNESAGTVSITVVANQPNLVNPVTYYTEDVTATGGGVDYNSVAQASAQLLTFPPNELRTSISIGIINDTLVEGLEQFRVHLQDAGNVLNLVITQPTATVNIIDNDMVVVEFDPASYNVSESGGSVTLTIVKRGVIGRPLQVEFSTADGTAIAGSDYTSTTETVIFPANVNSATVTVPILDDSDFEGDERFFGMLRLSASQMGVRLGVDQANVTITDDDLVEVGFDPITYTVSESAGQVNLRIVKRTTTSTPVTVLFSTMDGTAIAPGDYGNLTDVAVTFQPSDTSLQVQVLINDDSILESEENFFGRLVAQNPSIVNIFAPTATVSITDDDVVMIGFNPTDYTVSEDGGSVTFLIQKIGSNERDVTVFFSTVDGSATAPGDYGAIVSQSVTFGPSDTLLNVTVPINDDSVYELDEMFTAVLNTNDPGVVLFDATATATATITDDDRNAQVQCFSGLNCVGTTIPVGGTEQERIEECCLGDGITFSGGGESCRACIVYGWLDGPGFTGDETNEPYPLSIGFLKGGDFGTGPVLSYSVDVTAGTAAEGPNADFTVTNRNLLHRITTTTNPATSVILRVDELAQEIDETFQLTLVPNPASPNSAFSGTNEFLLDTITVTIIDQQRVTFSFPQSENCGLEPDEVITVRVRRNARIANPVTLLIVPLNYTEFIGSGFVKPLDFPEVPPEPQPPLINYEPNRAKSFPLDRRDFNITPIEITFEADEINTIFDVSVPIAIFDDEINEVEEEIFVVVLELFDATNTSMVDFNDAILCRIIDDDPIFIGFERREYRFDELETVFTQEDSPILIVKENGVVSEQIFRVSITAGAADRQGIGNALFQPRRGDLGDYSLGQLSQTLIDMFNAEAQARGFQFSILADDLPELPEAFGLTISTTSGDGGQFRVGTIRSTVVIIDDNDDVIVGFENTTITVTENELRAELCVRVFVPADTEPLAFTFFLDPFTVAGTADETDYVPLSAFGTNPLSVVQFDDSLRRFSFNVTIIDDSLLELTESFSVSIALSFDSPMTGIIVDPSVAVITILDDDGIVIGFDLSEYTVLEDAGVVDVTIRLIAGSLVGSKLSVAVNISSTDGSATLSRDFNFSHQTLIFNQLNTEFTVQVIIVDDALAEQTEMFFLNTSLVDSALIGHVLLRPDEASVMVIDYDVGYPFQLRLPMEHCTTWSLEKVQAIMGDIQKETANAISNYCNCSFPAEFIASGKLSCRNSPLYVTYRSLVESGKGHSAEVLNYIENWVSTSPTIVAGPYIVDIDPSCTIHISSLTDPECPTPTQNPAAISWICGSHKGLVTCGD